MEMIIVLILWLAYLAVGAGIMVAVFVWADEEAVSLFIFAVNFWPFVLVGMASWAVAGKVIQWLTTEVPTL